MEQTVLKEEMNSLTMWKKLNNFGDNGLICDESRRSRIGGGFYLLSESCTAPPLRRMWPVLSHGRGLACVLSRAACM
jgi:hypothetical protein